MLSFDEINRLAGQKEQRSMDIDQFFDEMEISAEDREGRKEFARQLEADLFAALALFYIVVQMDYPDGIQMVKDTVADAVVEAIERVTFADSALLEYAEDYADEFVDATIRNKGNSMDPELIINNEGKVVNSNKPDSKDEVEVTGTYFFSQDRAKLNAENEANTVFNYQRLRDAKANGMKYKQWNTMRDERVRMTHAEVDGTVVPIDGTFDVGGYPMHYPHEIGAPAQEVINCRCTLRFSKTLNFFN